MTSSLKELQEKLRELDQKLLLHMEIIPEANSSDYRQMSNIAKLEVEIDGEPTELMVGFPNSFPGELPKFFDKKDKFGLIPHKEPDGLICYSTDESLIIDERYLADILINCLEKVVKVVEQGLYGENKMDFLEEFEAYFLNGSKFNIHSYINVHNHKVRSLDLWLKTKDNPQLFVATELGENLNFMIDTIFHTKRKGSSKYSCIYFPLEEGTFFLPPNLKEDWDISKLKENIMSNLSNENKIRFKELLRNASSHENGDKEFIIVGLPTPNGNVALFSYLLYNNKAIPTGSKRDVYVHPFIQCQSELKMIRGNVKRWHPTHLLNRTGGNSSLLTKHVLLVGAGSIGSEIALRLAKAGVGKITLVDKDLMELENVHRHGVGVNRVFEISENQVLLNQSKVVALTNEIQQKYPFVAVKGINKWFSEFIEDKSIKLRKYDLAIVALGSPNTEMEINRRMLNTPGAPPTLYTWVEPLGIGGHVLVTGNKNKKGCYQCLFKPEGDAPIYNRSSFAEPFQSFSKTVTGCGSDFTPYSFLDSEKTTLLTVETGLRILTDELVDNPLFSWKGDANTFLKQGYKVTNRFYLSEEELRTSSLKYMDPLCPVCNDKEE